MTTISVVIPAFREEARIGAAVRSVRAHVPPDQLAEVVVVDHGSDDATVARAEAEGAKVLVFRDGTIAAQRNRGAAATGGDVLLFLDADVTLTPEWTAALPAALARLADAPLTLTGSHAVPPRDGGWLERHWFAHLADGDAGRHLGSAHLMMTRACFDAIGGFDAALETGEDFDICVRAVAGGGAVFSDRALVAVHHDFPKTVAQFVRREAWHGRGNFASLQMLTRSPVAMLTAGFAGLHVAALVALVVRPRLAVVPALGVAGLCAAASAVKFRHAPVSSRVVNAGVFYLYFLGRSIALGEAIGSTLSQSSSSSQSSSPSSSSSSPSPSA
ncbi:MAG: glycosyltransferase [Myxococcales bacterium]|nr:glycosyltransferase [Myxococcales bacterium]MCB9531320.1 glycosyltransferase [Myxococcales bacterium]